jgi:hypothetical protein
MSEAPSIQDQFEDIINFIVTDLQYDADRLLDQSVGPPVCEQSHKRTKIAYWEDVGIIPEEAAGLPGHDLHGNPTDQFNWCPYCNSHVWVNPSTPVGSRLECYWCKAYFRRSI